MQLVRAWLVVLVVHVVATVACGNKTHESSKPSADASTSQRDQDPVIQEIRGLRNAGMKRNDAKDFRGAMDEFRRAITLLHERVFGAKRASITDPRAISQDAAMYAQLLHDYGTILIRANEYDEAIEVLQDSIKMIEKIYGNSHPSMGLSLRSLADAFMAKKQYHKAIRTYKTLRKHIRRGLGVTHEAYIEASLKIADVYKKLGNKIKHLNVLKHALKSQGNEINGLTTGIAELYMELATAHLAMNEVDRAQDAAEMARVVFKQRDGDNSLTYAFSLNALAGVKMRQKKVDEAIQLLAQAHDIAVQLYGENHQLSQDSAKTLREVQTYKEDLRAEKDEL
ncbi:hypothetical protein PsorP6_012710 [Peronosclerospora sorghi]|uniref:Uncharacterized protein n=1 Tax=Peronosclerospora sorghi TaxID=230839 RepID=A0ACC0WGI9_9STRA|nr:hypothetical protein PsorP6_012710 [Peronosclerospora sorghi]